MAFFADMSPHTYSPTRGLEVLNVGWLDLGQPFPVGPTSQQFQDALIELCRHPIILPRGFHLCWFCRRSGQDQAGNGQIRVLSPKGVWYAAPTLVYHYVSAHQYSPPTDFVESVLSPDASGTDFDWFSKI